MFSISRRAKLAASVAAAGVAAMVALTPGAAQADAYYTYRISPVSNPFLFVEVAGASTDTLAQVDQWTWTDGSNQVWVYKQVSGGWQLMNAKSGKCLWTDGKAGDQLRQAPCTDSQWEVWSITDNGDITFSLHNPASGLYMEVFRGSGAQGGAIDAWPWNGGSNQRFIDNAA
jgi:hypothetical protein